jgi:hypothetical protein
MTSKSYKKRDRWRLALLLFVFVLFTVGRRMKEPKKEVSTNKQIKYKCYLFFLNQSTKQTGLPTKRTKTKTLLDLNVCLTTAATRAI